MLSLLSWMHLNRLLTSRKHWLLCYLIEWAYNKLSMTVYGDPMWKIQVLSPYNGSLLSEIHMGSSEQAIKTAYPKTHIYHLVGETSSSWLRWGTENGAFRRIAGGGWADSCLLVWAEQGLTDGSTTCGQPRWSTTWTQVLFVLGQHGLHALHPRLVVGLIGRIVQAARWWNPSIVVSTIGGA